MAHIADLAHVIAHWHDDRSYIDEAGRPRPLPLRGPDISLAALIARVYPKRAPEPIVEGLLRTGIVRRRKRHFECTSRHIVFPASAAAYLTGLIPILGLSRTLRTNLAGPHKLLQRTAFNFHIPVRELPALYRAIEHRVHPILIATDIDMMRRELRAKAGEPVTRIGFSVQVFSFPPEIWPSALREAPARSKGKSRKGKP